MGMRVCGNRLMFSVITLSAEVISLKVINEFLIIFFFYFKKRAKNLMKCRKFLKFMKFI